MALYVIAQLPVAGCIISMTKLIPAIRLVVAPRIRVAPIAEVRSTEKLSDKLASTAIVAASVKVEGDFTVLAAPVGPVGPVGPAMIPSAAWAAPCVAAAITASPTGPTGAKAGMLTLVSTPTRIVGVGSATPLG